MTKQLPRRRRRVSPERLGRRAKRAVVGTVVCPVHDFLPVCESSLASYINSGSDGKQADLMENLAEQIAYTRLLARANSDGYVSRMATTGRQIAAARTLLGWTQARLAQESGVSPASVQRAERALGIPRMQTSSLFALVRALERGGIQFIDADDTAGEGVRLRRRP
jgi:DNA-binding XRE family transcriptional regulator